MSDAPNDEPFVLLARERHVAVVTINRPRASNAINSKVSDELGQTLADLDADGDVRAIVLTGAGEVFCAGADLKAIARGESVLPTIDPSWGFAGIVEHDISTPLIAAINGPALGGGMEVVLTCDLAVMSERAILGLPEVQRGLFAAGGGVLRLPRQIPLKPAMELMLTGDAISAQNALSLGLVNRVSSYAEVLGEAIELAQRVARNAPLAVAASKRLAVSSAGHSRTGDTVNWLSNHAEMKTVFASEDAAEGARAFAEKRAPTWCGR